jgi:hypothetical protein
VHCNGAVINMDSNDGDEATAKVEDKDTQISIYWNEATHTELHVDGLIPLEGGLLEAIE